MSKYQNVGELRSRGVVKLREPDMFSLWVKTACGNMNTDQLRALADITDKYARGYLLFTTRQIPIIPFINLKDVERVQEELKKVYLALDRCGPTVRNVNVCYSDKICPEAVTNCLSLGEKLDNFFYMPMSHKVKIGVAGCSKDCIITRTLTDIGFVATENDGRKGYDVYIGGRLGLNPFVGVKMAECLGEEECVKLVQNFFDLMNREGKGEERSAELIARLGADTIKRELTKNLSENTGLEPIKCETASTEQASDEIIVRIRATCGEITTRQLRKIADLADRYGKGFVHFVVRGSPEIPGVAQRHLEAIRAELGEAGMELLDTGIDNIQSCFGGYCTESNVDAQSLLRNVERLVKELDLNNLNIKISASGCPNSCGIPQMNDIGFCGAVEPQIAADKCNGCGLCVPICKRKAINLADKLAVIDEANCKHCGLCITVCPFDAITEKRRGFTALVGGKEGSTDTRLGEVVAEFLSEEEALKLTGACLKLLKERNASAADVIDKIGIEKFKEMLATKVVL